MSDFFKLRKIDKELHELTKKISFVNINPINLSEEHEKVKEDPDYNPQFRYAKLTFDPDKLREALDSIDQDASVLGDVLEQKRKIAFDKVDMFDNRGSKKFSIYAKKAYGMPSEKALRKASEYLLLKSDREEKTVPTKKALEVLKSELIHHGFNYELGERDMSATASVMASSRKLFLRSNYKLSPNYVKRLVIHEIGTHVLRAENGRQQPFKIFMQGFPNYLQTEEGLAVWNEERFGLLLKENLKNYAARAIAVKMAQNTPFTDIYHYLRKFFSETWAFRLASRVKRGLTDSEKPGGVTRDYTYIEGYLRVKEHFKEKSLEEGINELYVGKIGLEHTELVREIPGVVKPKHLPENASFKSLLSF